MRRFASSRISFSRPNLIDSVGQALAHAGSNPAFCRSVQNVHLNARPSSSSFCTTPNGQEMTQYAQPLQMSGCTNTPPNSVRTMEPVGHASRQPATSQCLQTSDENSHDSTSGALPPMPATVVFSTNFTCRHVECPTAPVLSYEKPVQLSPSSATSFHSLHATSHALQPMHSVESVKKPVVVLMPLLAAGLSASANRF